MKRWLAAVLVALLLAVPLAQAAEYTDQATVKKVQQALNDKGYDCGTPDGVSGNKTKGAIRQYQADNGLEATGAIDDALYEALGLYEARDAVTDFDARLPQLDRDYYVEHPEIWAANVFLNAMLKLTDAGVLDADPLHANYPLDKNVDGTFPMVFRNKGEGRKLTRDDFTLGPGKCMICWQQGAGVGADIDVDDLDGFELYRECKDGAFGYPLYDNEPSETLEEAGDLPRLTWDIDECDYILVFGGYITMTDENYYNDMYDRYARTMIVFVIDARDMTCLHIKSVYTNLPREVTRDNYGYVYPPYAEGYIADLLTQ